MDCFLSIVQGQDLEAIIIFQVVCKQVFGYPKQHNTWIDMIKIIYIILEKGPLKINQWRAVTDGLRKVII